MAVFLRGLIAFLFLRLLIPLPAHAKKHETGFIDRSTTIQDVNYKYQVFIPEDWTPHHKWPVILALHGAGERGSDGLLQTVVGIGPAIRSNRSVIEAIVVMPQCPKGHWWTLPPMDDLAMAALAEATREFHGERTVPVTTGNNCSLPGTAQAYVFNATVLPITTLGYLTLWPDGLPLPTPSTLNAEDGAVASNMAIVGTTNGSIDAFADLPTQLILDVTAYFAP